MAMKQYLGVRWWRLAVPEPTDFKRDSYAIVGEPEKYRLISAIMPCVWHGPAIRAVHVLDVSWQETDTACPTAKTFDMCHCGVYALRWGKPDAIHEGVTTTTVSLQYSEKFLRSPFPYAFGSIELYGRVVCGVSGYRATHGIIRALVLQEKHDFVNGRDLAPHFERRYACPVTVVEDLNGYWEDYRNRRSAA